MQLWGCGEDGEGPNRALGGGGRRRPPGWGRKGKGADSPLAWAEEPPEAWPDILSGVCQGVSREIRCESVTGKHVASPCVGTSPRQPQLEQGSQRMGLLGAAATTAILCRPDVAPGSGPFKLRRT